MKKLLVGVGILVLVVGVGYVYAHGSWYGPMRGPGYGAGARGGYGDVEKGASITPEQKTKFQELHRKFDNETAQLRTSIFAKRQELQSLWKDPNADSGEILQKERELRDLQNQLRDKAAELKLEARKELTPEQLSRFAGRGMGSGYGSKYGRKYGRGSGYGMGPGSGFCY